MATEKPKTSDDLSSDRTDLAVERTVMAANRTMMAYVRTGLSLISFGFTSYKFLNALQIENVKLESLKGPRRLGLFLIALGTLAMISGTIEYWVSLKRMEKLYGKHYNWLSYSFFEAIAVGILGLFLFITILLHKEFF